MAFSSSQSVKEEAPMMFVLKIISLNMTICECDFDDFLEELPL